MRGAKLRKRQQKSHRVVALSDLDLIFFWLSLARYRTGPGGIPLPRQEEPNLLSFGPAPGSYHVWECIPKLAAPVKPELYFFLRPGLPAEPAAPEPVSLDPACASPNLQDGDVVTDGEGGVKEYIPI